MFEYRCTLVAVVPHADIQPTQLYLATCFVLNLLSRLNYLLQNLSYHFVEFKNFCLPHYSQWLFLSFSIFHKPSTSLLPLPPQYDSSCPLYSFLADDLPYYIPREKKNFFFFSLLGVNHFNEVGTHPLRLVSPVLSLFFPISWKILFPSLFCPTLRSLTFALLGIFPSAIKHTSLPANCCEERMKRY